MNKIKSFLSKGMHALIFNLPFSPWKRKVIKDFVFMILNLPIREPKSQAEELFDLKIIHEEHSKSNQNDVKKEYVEFNKDESLDAATLTLKCIAFYLPQFHTIPENDDWWGKGFTEWTNVTRAVPQFLGHYQPRLPGEFGFYDLKYVDIMHRQAALAAHYGLAGFCLYYYNFGGKRLLDIPHLHILNNPDLKMPFCLCWANENWTRRWDGKDLEVLIAQQYSDENDLDIIKDLTKSFTDPRYIRVLGKPLFLVYRPMVIPNLAKTINTWRTYCRENNIGEIYLIAIESFDIIDPTIIGFDATCEFPPHQSIMFPINHTIATLNPDYTGTIVEYKQLMSNFIRRTEPKFKRFSTVVPSWDNEARKPGKGFSVINSSPYSYSRWLYSACLRNRELPEDERLVFVNAWNEWAEAAYLEPDRRYGYAYLQATQQVLKQFNKTETSASVLKSMENSRSNFKKSSNSAIILHLYYIDLLEEFKNLISDLNYPIDLFITVTNNISEKDINNITALFPAAYILDVENRGRDILSFYKLLPIVKKMEYHQVCKLHTKKSYHRLDGDQWRKRLWSKLLNTECYHIVIDLFTTYTNIGIVALKEFKINLADNNDLYVNNTVWLNKILNTIDGNRSSSDYNWDFVGGSMFWFRPSALNLLEQLNIDPLNFEPELNQLDGTLAHSLERLFILLALKNGFETKWID